MRLLKHQGSNVGVRVGGGSRTELVFFLSCLLELPFIEPPGPPWCDQALTGFGDRALRSAGAKLGSVTEKLCVGPGDSQGVSPFACLERCSQLQVSSLGGSGSY